MNEDHVGVYSEARSARTGVDSKYMHIMIIKQ
jgi:hypothetical protein